MRRSAPARSHNNTPPSCAPAASKKSSGTPARLPLSMTRNGALSDWDICHRLAQALRCTGSTGVSKGRKVHQRSGLNSPKPRMEHNVPSGRGHSSGTHTALTGPRALCNSDMASKNRHHSSPAHAVHTRTGVPSAAAAHSFSSTSRLRCAYASASQSACRRTA